MDSFLDRAIVALVTRAPGWAVFVLAAFLYGCLGLALPLALHWRIEFMVAANVVFTIMAAVICVAWLVIQMEASTRRHLVEWTTNLRLLTSSEFEWLVGELFRREGWSVTETGREDGPDGNIDLELSRGSERSVVQCKRWTAQAVGVDEVRRFGGTLLREGLPATAGIFVTLSNFTEQAGTEAHQMGITLIDKRDLYSRMEKARRAEPCPDCQAPMVLSHSDYGWWLRCDQRGCRGKRDLGRDTCRALGLLLQH
jgi:HJR/Mrr/RecB family endonuclease